MHHAQSAMAAVDESINNENTFSMLRGKIQDAILDSLEFMGLIHQTEVQMKTLSHFIDGKDLFVLSEHESHDTLAYLIPVLEIMMRMQFEPKDGIGCIILAKEGNLDRIYLTLEAMLKFVPLTAAVVRKKHKIDTVKEVLAGGVNILVGHSDLVTKLLRCPEAENFSVANVKILVMVGTKGYNKDYFRYHVPFIVSKIPNDRQIVIFSRMITERLSKLIAHLRVKMLTINLIEEKNNLREYTIESNDSANSTHQINPQNHISLPKCDTSPTSNELPPCQIAITGHDTLLTCDVNYNSKEWSPSECTETDNNPTLTCAINCDSNKLLAHESTIRHNSMLNCSVNKYSIKLPSHQSTTADRNFMEKCIINNESSKLLPGRNTIKDHSLSGCRTNPVSKEEHFYANNKFHDEDDATDTLYVTYNRHLQKFLQIGIDYKKACILAHMQVSKLFHYEWDSLTPEEIALILEIDPLFKTTETLKKTLGRERNASVELKRHIKKLKAYCFDSIVCHVVNKTPMTEEQIKLIQDAIIQKLLMVPPKSQRPKFVSHRPKIDSLRFNCINLRTLDWLTNVVANLRLWPDCELSVIEKYQRPKCNIIMIPIHVEIQKNTEDILTCLEIQNIGLVTRYWHCIGRNSKKNKYGQSLTFIIDDYSFSVLKLMKLTLFYQLQRAPVYVLAMSENVEIEYTKPNLKEKNKVANEITELVLGYSRNQTKKETDDDIHTDLENLVQELEI